MIVMTHLILYSKKDCHLCEIAKEKLLEIQKEFPFSLLEIDIKKNTQGEASNLMNRGIRLTIPPRPKRARAIK